MSSDSMLYVVGSTGSFGKGSQVYLNKYTRSGQLIWNRIWGGTGTEDARSVITDGDSTIYVAGTTSSYSNGLKDIFILKYDAAGTLTDSIFWGGKYNEVAKDVAMYGSWLYITGETQSFGNGKINGDHKTDGLLLKVNGRTMQAPDSTMSNVSLPVMNDQPSVEIFPNPVTNTTTVRVNSERMMNCELVLFDMLRQVVFRKSLLLPEEVLNLNLPGGIYFYRVNNEGQFISSGKIIVQ